MEAASELRKVPGFKAKVPNIMLIMTKLFVFEFNNFLSWLQTIRSSNFSVQPPYYQLIMWGRQTFWFEAERIGHY